MRLSKIDELVAHHECLAKKRPRFLFALGRILLAGVQCGVGGDEIVLCTAKVIISRFTGEGKTVSGTETDCGIV